jgi:cytochrome c-type biogenesis protein CcmH
MIRVATPARRTLVMLLAVLLVLSAAVTASAATPRASFNDIEDEVMCITCNVPLNIAESAQATDERDEIRRLIALGLTKDQILDRLVADFGPQILADPPTDGFNVTTWLVPIGAVGGVGLLLVLALPRWRRRARDDHDAGGPSADEPSLSPADLRRLDEDLAATER